MKTQVPQQRTNSRMLGDIDLSQNITSSVATITDKPLLGANGTGQRKDYLDNTRPLLGVNGTGQLKDLTDPTKPPIVSEPINPYDASAAKTKTSTTSSVVPASSNDNSPRTAIDDWIDNVDISRDETDKLVKKNNFTAKEDDHMYYKSLVLVDNDYVTKYWGNFEQFKTDELLSQSYRRAFVSIFIIILISFVFFLNNIDKYFRFIMLM